MRRDRRPFLGWIQLVHARARFATGLAGVAFAVVLVFMQLGFMNMLFDTTVMVHRMLAADLVLVSTKVRDMSSAGTIPRRRLAQALAVDGVADGEVLYVALRDWIKPAGDRPGERGQMMVIGVRPDFAAFRDPAIAAQLPLLHQAGSVLFDAGSRGDYRAFAAAIAAGAQPEAELAGRTARAQGLFRLGSSLGVEGTLITSEDSFFLYAPTRSSGAPSLALLRLVPGARAEDVAARINAAIDGEDTQAMTMAQFIAHSRGYIARESPVSFIFSLGTAIGLLVGTVVLVQILTAEVQDHLPEYATFLAIGFSRRWLLGIVFEQAAILAVLGFLPGLAIAAALYQLIRSALAIPIALPVGRILLVFLLTVGMCLLSGAMAMRRLRRADPAEVFG